jgi:hypothetical protein
MAADEMRVDPLSLLDFQQTIRARLDESFTAIHVWSNEPGSMMDTNVAAAWRAAGVSAEPVAKSIRNDMMRLLPKVRSTGAREFESRGTDHRTWPASIPVAPSRLIGEAPMKVDPGVTAAAARSGGVASTADTVPWRGDEDALPSILDTRELAGRSALSARL